MKPLIIREPAGTRLPRRIGDNSRLQPVDKSAGGHWIVTPVLALGCGKLLAATGYFCILLAAVPGATGNRPGTESWTIHTRHGTGIYVEIYTQGRRILDAQP